MLSLMLEVFQMRNAPIIRLTTKSKKVAARAMGLMLKGGHMLGCEGNNEFQVSSPDQLKALDRAGIKYQVIKGQELVKRESRKKR